MTVTFTDNIKPGGWPLLYKLNWSFNSRSRRPATRQHLIMTFSSTNVIFLKFSIITILLLSAIYIKPTYQNLCPLKYCNCDDQLLEVRCKGYLGTSGLPHTLNPNSKRILINFAQITQISSDSLSEFRNLETLDLAENKLTLFDFDHIKSNSALVYLNTSRNNIIELKDSAVNQARDKLDSKSISSSHNFDENELNVLKALRKPKLNILELVVSHNQITILKDYTFLRFSRLARLDLSHNRIVALENESLFGLIHLKHLDLRANHLTQVPSMALQSSSKALNSSGLPAQENRSSPINSIDLSQNVFVSIEPDSFNMMEGLREIYLDMCSIQSIDVDALRGLTGLRLLSMQDNELGDLPPGVLSDTHNLAQLKLNGNRIDKLRSGSFRYLNNLEELQISNTSLRHIQVGAFDGLVQLRKLELNNNPNLSRIGQGVFNNLQKLSYLSLYMSSITSLPQEIGQLPLIKILDLRSNSLECDCDLKWLTKWLNETTSRNAKTNRLDARNTNMLDHQLELILSNSTITNELINITCANPPALTGKPIIEIQDNGLECLHPTSELNVQVGFACLFMMIMMLTTVCTINFCRNEKHLIGIFKENLAQSPFSMMLYYPQNILHKNDNPHHNHNDNHIKKEPSSGQQAESVFYEQVDYGPNNGPVYTIPCQEDHI